MRAPKSLPLLLLIIGLALAASAQTKNSSPKSPEDLIAAALTNADANAKSAYDFNFHEDWSTVTNDTNYPSPVHASIQYDVTFIDTFPFRRKVGVEHHPLTPDAADAEDARYDKEFARIRAMSPAQRILSLRDANALLFDPFKLINLYTCRITGHKSVENHPTTVIDCKPNPALVAKPPSRKKSAKNKAYADADDNDAFTADELPSDITVWVDDQQPFFHRTRMVLSTDMGTYGKNTVVTDQWSLIENVWHHTSSHISYTATQDHPESGEIFETYSNFKRFRSEVTFAPNLKVPPEPTTHPQK